MTMSESGMTAEPVDKGMAGVVAAETELSDVRGDLGAEDLDGVRGGGLERHHAGHGHLDVRRAAQLVVGVVDALASQRLVADAGALHSAPRAGALHV